MDGVDTGPMVAEVIRQGMQVIEIECSLGYNVNFYELVGISGNFLDRRWPSLHVVGYGDIDFVRQMQRTPFIPGAWCTFDNMKCSTYYAYLGEYLLNKDYVMMPAGDLLRRWDALIDRDVNRSLFLRPDSGAKPFTGYVIEPEGRDKIQTLVETVGPDMLVVVARKKQITAEWRFVICDRKVVTGCQYLPNEDKWFHPESFRLAHKIASKEWQPDLCYTVDIAESEGKMYLLEINSFGCAGLYVCDMESVIRRVSVAATKEWREYV